VREKQREEEEERGKKEDLVYNTFKDTRASQGGR
jgi:hypothetical protein